MVRQIGCMHVVLFGAMLVSAAGANPTSEHPQEILPLDQVRVGMQGYGLTVFQGTHIEPFAVEVVSVMRSYFLGRGGGGPKRGIIWIRCTDERMRQSGPVSGMSGSPIYIWGEGEPGELGRGGRLIGAFALGYRAVKECYAGVQPIEQMRDVGSRARHGGQVSDKDAASRSGTGESTAALSRKLLAIAATRDMPPHTLWRTRALARLFEPSPSSRDTRPPHSPPQSPRTIAGEAVPLLLPVRVRSSQLAEAIAPLLENMGMTPIASGNGSTAGKPPPWIRSGSVRLEPGSVLSIPLAFGDMDLSAAGTVTEILPDGNVLAFGHAMHGRGETALPMATGYVHFVLPSILGSFKLTGSADIHGAIVRDEVSSVVGRRDATFDTASVDIAVRIAGQAPQQYQYKVAHHRQMTPVIAGIVAAESLTVVQSLPMDNTVRLKGSLTFEGENRELQISSVLPRGSGFGVLFELIPPLEAMAMNRYETVMLEKMDLSIDVENDVRLGSIIHGRLDHAEVAPGDRLGITVRIQKHGDQPIEQRVELKIPDTVPEGNYNLMVSDARNYVTRLLANRPHLTAMTNVDELFQIVQRIVGISAEALYVTMELPVQGLAVGRQELPRLPSSRQALIATPASTLATPYREWIETCLPMDMVTVGDLKFTITVSKSATDR